MNVDLNGCINGRKQAWDAFVQQTAGIIYAAVQRTMRSRSGAAVHPSDLEDLAQNVYVKLLQNNCRLLKTYDPERASLSTWLTLVARSTTRDTMLKRRLETLPLIDAEGALASSPTSNGVHREMPEVAGMETLTERQRHVLHMLFDEAMTVEQAAARLGVDPQTIRSTKHKALSRLRMHMKAGETE